MSFNNVLKKLSLVLVGATVMSFLLTIHFSLNTHADNGYYEISGTVTNQQGTGVSGVSVTATDPGGTNVDFGPAVTSSDGTYTLEVEAGNYDFHFTPASESELNPIVDSDISVSSNRIIDMQLTPVTYTLSGTLTDADGSPVANFSNLYATDANGNTVGTFSTDANGNFSVQLPAGQYGISILDSCNGCSYDPHGATLDLSATTTPIDLTTGNVTKNLIIPTTDLNVTVENSRGDPISGATVTANSNGGNVNLGSDGLSITDTVQFFYSNGATNSNGTVTLASLIGATYSQSSGALNQQDNICAEIPNAQTICIPAPQTITGDTTIVLQEQPATYTFSGTLTDSAGNPLANFSNLYATDANGNTVGTFSTDANGNFSVQLPSGQYGVSVMDSCNGCSYDPHGATLYLSATTTPIDLTAGNITENLIIPTTQLNVIVEDSSGNPVSGATVTANANDGSANLGSDGLSIPESLQFFYSNGMTNASGEAALASLNGAAYSQSSGQLNQQDNICAEIPNAQTICIPAPQTITGDTTIILQEQPATPSPPTNLTAPSPTNLYPSLSWSTTSGATSYNIYRNGSLIGNTTSTTYTDSSLTTTTPGSTDGTYSYTVTAVNSSGESTQSSPITVVYDTTPPVVTITGVVSGETYAANNTPTPVCNTTDSLSGVATNATVSVSNSGNSYTATCSGASDNAGNIAPSVSDTYTVLPSNYTLVNLTNSSSSYLSGAKVTIENSASQVTTLSTDSFGNTYLNTTPGTYKVTVYYANGYESQNITVTANGPNNINFTTVPVTVTINDPNTTDLANATVAQAGNTGTFGTKQPVNSNGQITFQVLPGTNYFTAYVANGYQEQSITATTGTNTVTYNTDSVQVTVTKNGSPLPTATVDQAGNSGTYGSKQHVNSNGQYTFYVLPGTNYFEAFDGSNSAKQTLNVTANTTTTIGVN